jgi:LysR family glycine cleavage system transcriptional activator
MAGGGRLRGRGVAVAPFISLANARRLDPRFLYGIYALNLQPSAAAHPGCSLIMQWFTQQAEQPAARSASRD